MSAVNFALFFLFISCHGNVLFYCLLNVVIYCDKNRKQTRKVCLL